MGQRTPGQKPHLSRKEKLALRRAQWAAYDERLSAQRPPEPPKVKPAPVAAAGPVRIIRGSDVVTLPAYSPAELARVLGDREPIAPELRRLVLKRDGYRCRYCRRGKGRWPWHIDHVNPVALGGSNAYDNLVTACQPCNLKKGMQIWKPIPLDEMRRGDPRASS